MKPSVKAFTRGLVLVVAASLPLLATTARAAEGAAQLGPQELVTKVAQDTLRDLDAHRSEYQKNPNRVRELVDKNMLPHFDTAYAAQLVLAKHWRTANAEQRKRFVEAFYQSLLQNYGEALLEFTPDRLKILPFQGKADDKVATVRSEVRRDNGQRVPVNYSLRQTPNGWKAYDVQIEGVSYVKSFRTDFGSEIQQKGLEPVIQRLEQQVASGTVQKPGAPAASSQTCVREEVVKETGVSRARLESLGGGRFRVSGVLDASTAREVLEQSESRFAQSKEIDVDLGGVGESDSAGLALLIEWLRAARQGGRAIRFANVPAQIEALARISEVEDLIGGEKKAEAEKRAEPMKKSG